MLLRRWGRVEKTSYDDFYVDVTAAEIERQREEAEDADLRMALARSLLRPPVPPRHMRRSCRLRWCRLRVSACWGVSTDDLAGVSIQGELPGSLWILVSLDASLFSYSLEADCFPFVERLS